MASKRGKQYPFVVQPDKSKACKNCKAGTMFDVVYDPDDVALGTSYNSKDDAEDMAEELNRAFELGFNAGKVGNVVS
jgi:hypothetical protein